MHGKFMKYVATVMLWSCEFCKHITVMRFENAVQVSVELVYINGSRVILINRDDLYFICSVHFYFNHGQRPPYSPSICIFVDLSVANTFYRHRVYPTISF